MRSQFLSMLAIAAGLVLSCPSAPATAEIINTHGSACQPSRGAQVDDFEYGPSGIRNNGESSRSVTCPVPRTPLDSGATTADFYVDFTLAPHTTIICTLYSYDDNTDTLLGSKAFNTTNNSDLHADYDMLVQLPSSVVPIYSHAAVVCSLPNNFSVLRGVTSRP